MTESGMSADQIKLALIQQLEGLRRAGVTHWKQIAAVAPAPTETKANPVSMPLSLNQPPSKSAPLGSPTKEPLPVRSLSQPALIPQSDPAISAVNEAHGKNTVTSRIPFTPLNLSLEDRILGLKSLADKVRQCTRCHELAATRTQTVFGVGNPQAKILFVGEAPGADEDAKGEPFVGKAGQLLNDIIKACRLRREDIYICNVLRCRPPGNRLPAPDECANCREFLDGQIAHVNPEYIVCWGACAAQNLLSSTDSIGKLRRRFFTYGNSKVLCTYHPSYLLRNPSAKKDVWEDMKMLFQDMGIDLSKKA